MFRQNLKSVGLPVLEVIVIKDSLDSRMHLLSVRLSVALCCTCAVVYVIQSAVKVVSTADVNVLESVAVTLVTLEPIVQWNVHVIDTVTV